MLYIKFDRIHGHSYSKNIYKDIREKILSGNLRTEEKLPSTRECSKNLSVSRNTILTAYEMLVSEGLVMSKPGSGFFVSSDIIAKKHPLQVSDSCTASLSDISIPTNAINFDSGLPALDLFPKRKWNKAATKALKEAPISALGYDDPQGRSEFREVLRKYLQRTRGIVCDADQIIVTNGTKQGLTLVAKCLLDAQSEIWIENPTNDNVRQIFSYHTNNITPFEVDKDGIQPCLFFKNNSPTLIFMTPSHQFPMGGRLPIKRRLEVIKFARENDCLILEDDYDSEFTYEGSPANSLFELDPQHVIYSGTFSKVLFPSIRLGYLVVPRHLVSRIREIKRLADHHSNSITQLTLMHFIESKELERHIRRMKKEYGKRREQLLFLLHKYFGENIKIHGDRAGMHVVAEFNGVIFTQKNLQRLQEKGVYVVPVEKHSMLKGKHQSKIILGYAHLSCEIMETGLNIIKAELNLSESL
ncbi:MAG: PLP-dependent aminotransferase family protein [Citrobacter telavivensis]